MKKQKEFLRRFKIEKKLLIKGNLRNILATEVKQQKIKLNEDERKSTNNKNKNDELNNMLSVVNRIYQFFENNSY